MTTGLDDARAVSAANADAGYVGLGITEFVALAMHENRPASAYTLGLLELADASLVEPTVLAYGRSSLVARGLMTMPDADSIEPAGIGRLVASAAANATRWLTIGSFLADTAIDGVLIAVAPAGSLAVVRRPLLSMAVAPAEGDTLVDIAVDALERQFSSYPDSAISFRAATMASGSGRTVLVRHARDADGGLDESRFEIAIGVELDERGADRQATVDDEGLESLLAEYLDLPEGDAS